MRLLSRPEAPSRCGWAKVPGWAGSTGYVGRVRLRLVGTGLGRTVAGRGGSGAGRGRSGAGRGLGLYYYGDDHGAAAVVVADPLAYYAAG
jgi:hypothetical protein